MAMKALMKKQGLVFGILLLVCLAAAGCFSNGSQPAETAGTAATIAETTPAGQVSAVPPPAETTVITTAATTVATTATPDPSALREEPGLTTIARMKGGSGLTSQNITVPTGYWELWYTVDPLATGGQDSRSATGSQSALFPTLSIKITDTRTGTVVDTIEPPGGLDETLWASSDPRPWSVKFYGGNTEYNFLVTGRHIESFTLEVRVRK